MRHDEAYRPGGQTTSTVSEQRSGPSRVPRRSAMEATSVIRLCPGCKRQRWVGASYCWEQSCGDTTLFNECSADAWSASVSDSSLDEICERAESTPRLHRARKAIADGMAFTLGLWFVPVPVLGSVACNSAEKDMIKEILKAMREPFHASAVDALFWFFRKKYLLVNTVTLVPWVGPAVQLLEAYALGQFVLVCCERKIGSNDPEAMARAWTSVEPMIWRGDAIIEFYESNSGKPFPDSVRLEFVKAIQTIGNLAQGINRIPGLARTQETLGETMHSAIRWGELRLKNIKNRISR